MADFSGLRSNTSVTYATHAREASFFDVVASQLTSKVSLFKELHGNFKLMIGFLNVSKVI